jgi:membrane-associated phospholipid phosphatase
MYLLGLAYLLIGYLGTNEFAALNPLGRPALPIATEFDHALPFTPWTVVFYVMYYPLLLTPLFLCNDVRALSRLTIAQAAINTVAYFFFVLFPTPIDRPAAAPVEGVFHFVLDVLFRADHPYNTFPSLHVAQTCILALFFLHYSGARTAFFHGACSILVAASAVLIKQHYLADVFSGALLAYVAARVFFPSRT